MESRSVAPPIVETLFCDAINRDSSRGTRTENGYEKGRAGGEKKKRVEKIKKKMRRKIKGKTENGFIHSDVV